jgi:hypothetical protein
MYHSMAEFSCHHPEIRRHKLPRLVQLHHLIILPSDDFSIQFMNSYSNTTTAMMLVSPNKKASSKPASDGDGDSSSLPSSGWAAEHNMRTIISTPPPLEDSTSNEKMRRPLSSPPPLPKRCKHNIVPQEGHASVNSSVFDQETPPASAKSVLIQVDSSLSVPRLRLVVPTFTTQEPQEEGSSGVGSTPILSYNTLNDDGDDAELASYFPRIRLQMRPRWQRRRFVTMEHAGFIPIQDDPCDDSSVGDDE